MAGNDRDGALKEEIAELEALLLQVKTPGNVRDLKALLETKRATEAAKLVEPEVMEVEEQPIASIPQPSPVKVAVTHDSNDAVAELHSFKEISKFGWEDEGFGKDKVTVYIMSGIDGVGDLPKENVSCQFTKTSFDLKILGLRGTNYRLVKYNLDKEIDPKKSTYRVKKNRITISLWKEDKNNTWMNLTAKNPTKSTKSSSDPTANLMEMMKNMYDEGDDDMKRTIAQAWAQSREKQATNAL